MSKKQLKAVKILNDIKLDDAGLSLELHSNCVTDDIEMALNELSTLQNNINILIKYIPDEYKHMLLH